MASAGRTGYIPGDSNPGLLVAKLIFLPLCYTRLLNNLNLKQAFGVYKETVLHLIWVIILIIFSSVQATGYPRYKVICSKKLNLMASNIYKT